MAPQVLGVTSGSPLYPWCCRHSSWRDVWHKVKKPLYKSLVCFAHEVTELEDEPERRRTQILWLMKRRLRRWRARRLLLVPLFKWSLILLLGLCFNNCCFYDHCRHKFFCWCLQHSIRHSFCPCPRFLLSTCSHSGATIPFVRRKKKVIAPYTNVTFSKTLPFIEDMDMVELIKHLMKGKVPLLAYSRIQKFFLPMFVYRVFL